MEYVRTRPPRLFAKPRVPFEIGVGVSGVDGWVPKISEIDIGVVSDVGLVVGGVVGGDLERTEPRGVSVEGAGEDAGDGGSKSSLR